MLKRIQPKNQEDVLGGEKPSKKLFLKHLEQLLSYNLQPLICVPLIVFLFHADIKNNEEQLKVLLKVLDQTD